MMKGTKNGFLALIVALTVFAGYTLVQAQDACPPGYYFSRETIACEQEVCPPGSGRNYTLECNCAEGTTARYEERVDPATGNPYNILAACDGAAVAAPAPAATSVPQTRLQALGAWWNQQGTTTKGVIIVGASGALAWILVSTGIAGALWGLITGAGAATATALTAAQATMAPVISGYLAGTLSAVEGRALIGSAVSLIRKYYKKELAAMAPAQASAFLRTQLLSIINGILPKLGQAPWSMANLEVFLKYLEYLL